MAQYLTLPNGSRFEVRQGETREQALAKALEQYPEAFGFGPSKQEAAPRNQNRSALGDIATAFKQGVIGSTKALTDVFGAGNTASDYLEGKVKGYQQEYSPARQEELKRQAERMKQAEQAGTASEIGAALRSFAEAPVSAVAQGLGSFVPYLPTLALGPVAAALRLAPATAATAQAVAIRGLATAQGAGAVKGSVYDAVYEKEVEAGVDPEVAKRKAEAAQNYIGKNWDQIAGGAALGFLAGGSGIEKLLTREGAQAASQKMAPRVGRAMLEEGLTEAPQGGQERLAQNIALQREGYEVPTFQGVAGQATLEGLTGAFSAAPVAALRGPSAPRPEEDPELAEAKRIQEEQDRQRAAQKAFRATDEGRLQFVQEYDQRAAQYKELEAKANAFKPTSPQETADLKEMRDQLKELRKGLMKDRLEYKKAREQVAQQLERQRVETMTPEDYMLEQAGMQVKDVERPAMKTVIDEFGQIREVPAEEQEAPSAAAQYLTSQIQAARGMGALDLAELADFAMQNPVLAKQAVTERVRIPGLSAQDSNALLGGINLRLKEAEKERAGAVKEEMAQRAADIKAQAPTTEMPDQTALDLGQFYDEKVAEGQGYVEPTFEYLDPIFEKALSGQERVVGVDEAIRPIADAAKRRARVESLLQEADKADRDAEIAASRRDNLASRMAQQRGTEVIRELDAVKTQGDPYSRAFMGLRRAQDEALARVTDATEKLRTNFTLSGPDKKIAGNVEVGLEQQAAKARADFITAALQEAALHRRAAGQPSLTQDEAIKAASKLRDTIDAWTERAKTKNARPQFEEVIVQPAQMRANKIVRPAITERREVSPGTQAISPSEIAHFKARIDSVRRQLLKAPQVPATRVQGEFLKRQYAQAEAVKVAEQRGETAQTLAGELRRRREYVSNLLEKAIPKAPEGGTYEYTDADGNQIVERVEAMREVLQRAKDMIDDGNADRALLDAAENQARRVLEGRDMGEVYRPTRRVTGKRAMATLPSREGSAVPVLKRRKGIDMAEREYATYRAGEAEIEPDEALRELKEAIKLNERVMQENAGQKSLFPEAEKDLGYIRATPENFAKSPRIKPVWEALDKARRAAAVLKGKHEARTKRQQTTMAAIKQLEARIEQISGRTEFFWRDQKKFTNEEIAKVLVDFPSIGKDAEERKLINKYLQQQKLTPEEASRVESIRREFMEKHLPKYKAQFDQIMKLLAEEGTVDATDNQLAQFMISSNKQVRDAAKALQERLSPLRRTIEFLQSTMKKSAVLTPAQRQLQKADEKAKQRRSQFEQALEKAWQRTLAEIETARAELLDPLIPEVAKALESSKTTLAKEQTELDNIKKRFDAVLSQQEGKDRTQLATYQLFRYEEKKAVLDDLKKKIEQQEELLGLLVEERFEEIDGARIAGQAMLDRQVQFYKRLTENAEKKVAELRGDNVLDRPKAYPFASRLAQAERDSAKKQFANAEAMKAQFEKQLAENKKEENILLKQWGGEGIRRVDGRIETLKTAQQKAKDAEMDRLLEEEDKATAKALRDAAKQALVAELEEKYENLMLELGALPGPNDVNQLAALLDDPKTNNALAQLYQAKITVIQQVAIVNGQLAAIKEGKPVREQKAATVASTAKLAGAKPFRTGNLEARTATRGVDKDIVDELKQINEMAAKIRGTKAKPEKTTTPKYRKPLDENIGLFDEDYDLLAPDNYRYNLVYDGQSADALAEKDVVLAHVFRQLIAELEAYGKAPGPNNIRTVAQALREKYERLVEVGTQSAQFRKYLKALDSLDLGRVGLPLVSKTINKVSTLRAAPTPARASSVANRTPEQTAEYLASKYKADGVAADAQYNGMTFAEAARYGARKTTSPMVRALFERLAEVFDQAPPAEGGQGRVYALAGTITSRNRKALGVFNPPTNTVAVVHGRSTTNKTLLHELMHAATFYGLNKDSALDQKVTELRERVKAWLETPQGRAYFRQKRMELQAQKPGDIYGLTDNDEFLAELYSDRGFQKLLTEVPSSTPRKSVFTRFIEFLSSFFDMPSKAAQSAFADAIALSEEVFNVTVQQVYGGKTDIVTDRGDLLKVEPKYASPAMEKLGRTADKVVAKQRGWVDTIKANASGLAFETQLVDRFAGFERLKKYMNDLKGTQMMYYLRMYDQRMNFVSASVGTGVPQLVKKARKDGRDEYVIETRNGPNIANVVKILRDAESEVGNAEAVNRLFTLYLAALRADRVGLEALNFSEDVTQEMLDDAIATVEGNDKLKDVFGKARAEYNAYNRDLMSFLADTGAISKEMAAKLGDQNDYIPFYREQGGNAVLMIGGETPLKVGSIAEQPYLQELVGGDTAILDFMTSSVQNTNMLIDMGLRNQATKNAVMNLVDIGGAKFVRKTEGKDVVRFKLDGEDRYVIVDTETVTVGDKKFDTGVPADLLVKGMEGIPVQLTGLMRAMSIPSQLLRKAVTLSPVYMAKQLIRDSLAAPILTGANFTPVLGALRQFRGPAKETLERRGIVGGQQFQGTTEDMAKILRDIASGRPGWQTALSKWEALGMEADALTRRAQYNGYIEQGLSEMEATLLALESMNFNKRGASPSIHWLNSMIPFFNAQIQGLNVLYKAMTGNLPFSDRLKIQQKMLVRGSLLAVGTLAYAAAMSDDEAYKNATPDQKYGNWFVRLPGVDEPIRVPVPFEIGYIFKALPEAIYNTMTDKHGGEDAVKAFKQILLQSIPGGSSMPKIDGYPVPVPIPQIMKPAIEAALGKSFFTNRDILSAQEKGLLPEEQHRPGTSEFAKMLGRELGLSPVMTEYVVRGYTGTLGIAFLHALSLGVPKSESPEAAVKRLSEYPLIGGAFQPNDAGGILNNVYERFKEDNEVRNTFQKYIKEGRTAEANSILQRRGNEILEAEIGDVFKKNMDKLTQAERAIRASAMSPEEKRQRLDELRRIKTGIAQSMRDAADRTTPR